MVVDLSNRTIEDGGAAVTAGPPIAPSSRADSVLTVGMLTIQDIQQLKVNPEIAREALKQAEARHDDLEAAAKNLEKRAFTLLAGYSTVALFLFDQALKAKAAAPLDKAYLHFAIPGVMLIFANCLLVFAVRTLLYGSKGAHPASWLQPNTLDGDNGTLGTMLAYETHSYAVRIDASSGANRLKGIMLDLAIATGVAALGVFAYLVAF